MKHPRSHQRRSRGYTLIEVMIAISLLTIISSGVVALQKMATIGNMRAKELAIGTQLARTWIERLRTDAASWNYPSPSSPNQSDIAQTSWLNQVETQPNTWFMPPAVGLKSAGFDALGNDVPPANMAQRATFCTHLRLAWMYPGEVIRADVRVFWRREGGKGTFDNAPVCAAGQAQSYINRFSQIADAPLSSYHLVYLSSSILKNTAP